MPDITIINSGLLVKNPSIPIGPLMIVSVLEKAGYEVEFRDYQGGTVSRKPDPNVFKKFCETDANIIGISVMCNSMPTVLLAVKKIKEEDPDKIIILGGPGATDVGAQLLKDFPVDYIVMGEGEFTIIELMDTIKKGKNPRAIKGIAYKEQDMIVVTTPRERIQNLGSLPLPAYHHIDLSDYDGSASILTVRGCPFHCKFCSTHSIYGGQVIKRDLSHIIEEIKLLAPQSKLIAFVDDTFIADKKWALQIVDIMKAEGINLKWSCNGKIPLMDKEMLNELKQRNCHMIFYGIESGSERVLKMIKKGHTPEQARRVIEMTIDNVEYIRTSYIWGYPFATVEDFYLTLDNLYADMQLPTVISQLSQLSPLPSAPLFKEYGDHLAFDVTAQSRAGGLPINENLADYPELIQVILQYSNLFTSFYYFDHPDFQQKLKIMKNVDWNFNEEERKRRGYS